MGRTWRIMERGPPNGGGGAPPSLLRRLLEEGIVPSAKDGGDGDDKGGGGDDDEELRVAQTVHEPRTGAVGHLPVLAPGEVRRATDRRVATDGPTDGRVAHFRAKYATQFRRPLDRFRVSPPAPKRAPQVFEYMSGCDVGTPSGAMEGAFHMASVDLRTTESAHVGDADVEALGWRADDPRRFEAPVGRFGLRADDDEDV